MLAGDNRLKTPRIARSFYLLGDHGLISDHRQSNPLRRSSCFAQHAQCSVRTVTLGCSIQGKDYLNFLELAAKPVLGVEPVPVHGLCPWNE